MRFSRFGRASWDPTDCEASACESLLSRAEPSPPPWTRTYKDVDGPKTALSLRPHYQRRAPPSSLALGRRIYPLYAASVRSLGASLYLLGLRLGHWHGGRNGRGSVDGLDRGSWTVSLARPLSRCASAVFEASLPPSPLPSPRARSRTFFPSVHHQHHPPSVRSRPYLHPASLPIMCPDSPAARSSSSSSNSAPLVPVHRPWSAVPCSSPCVSRPGDMSLLRMPHLRPAIPSSSSNLFFSLYRSFRTIRIVL